MTAHITLSSARHDWRTPDWFLDLVSRVAPIGLDPCTTEDNPTGAQYYMTQSADACGLSLDWGTVETGGCVFVNPPYGPFLSGDIDPDYEHTWKSEGGGPRVLVGHGRGWARKIARSPLNTIALLPVRTETVWWRELYAASSRVLLWSSGVYGSRINFVDPATGEIVKGINFASTVFCISKDSDFRIQFEGVFTPHGTMVIP